MRVPPVKPGTAPGSLLINPLAIDTQVKVYLYNATDMTEISIDDLLAGKVQQTEEQNLWVQIIGLKTVDLLKRIGDFFSLHPLALEDAVNTYQRPKVDSYDHYQFIVCKVVSFQQNLQRQQMSMFLGSNFLISLFERPDANFDMLMKALNNAQSHLRHDGPDRIAYGLLDITIDGYFPVMSHYSDLLDEYENTVINQPDRKVIRAIQSVKRDLRALKMYVWSHRDLLNILIRNDQSLIQSSELVYFRDCYDHTVQQIDILESLRDSATSLADIYLSSLANKVNGVMKVLTVISLIFLPPTFLAAVWGMNFTHMPELHWQYGYLFAWLAMILSSVVFCLYFWLQGWFKSVK